MGEARRLRDHPEAPERRRRRRLWRDLQVTLSFAFIMTALGCCYVLALFALRGSAPFDANDVTLSGVIAAYLGSALMAGTLAGVLWQTRDRFVGRLAISFLAAWFTEFCVSMALYGPFWRWPASHWRGVFFLAAVFGLFVAVAWRKLAV